jgi:predicted metal-dependent peptidase
MNKTIKEIKIDFPEGTKKQGKRIINTIERLPPECIDFLSDKKIIFIKSSKDELASFLKNEVVRNYECIIILNPAIWVLKDDEFQYVISHEIAHYFLNHDSKREIGSKEEKIAHDLTVKWMIKILSKNKKNY